MTSRSRRDRGRSVVVAEPTNGDVVANVRSMILAGDSNGDIVNYLHSSDSAPPTSGNNSPSVQPVQPVQLVQPVVQPVQPVQPKPDQPEGTTEPFLQFVKSVDLLVDSNAVDHHTEEFDVVKQSKPYLVVRRGQPFKIEVHFTQDYCSEDQDLRFTFQTGPLPTESKRTRVSFLLSDEDNLYKWGTRLIRKTKQSLEVNVFTGPYSIVGKWIIGLSVSRKGVASSSLDWWSWMYILFNPWCQEDVVYKENEDELKEYVLNDTGCIFVGTAAAPRFRPWAFGQFSGNVLDCCIYLLDSSGLKMQARGDSVKVARKLTALVNGNDDEGLVVGRWDGKYAGGIAPGAWTGSAQILEMYYRNKTSVKYGQCWVFSGVLTTIFRALGIPCRCVTNFRSAHDTDVSLTVDEHVDKNMDPVKHMNSDMIWNYHTWNEAWMRREDLSEAYGGWQVCDATPQETSEGVFQCGPCPVRAVKEGDVTVLYDASFVFAEVNADKVLWQWDEQDLKYNVVDVDTKLVGMNIMTRSLKKRSGNDAAMHYPEIITHLYKYQEGSPGERAAVVKANRTANPQMKIPYRCTGIQDVEVRVEFDPKSRVGKDFFVRLVCRNTSKMDRTINCHGSIHTMYYTGIVADKVAFKDNTTFKMAPGASQLVELKATEEDYRPKAKDGWFLYFTMVVLVTETGQSAIKSDAVMLIKPELTIHAPTTSRVGNVIDVVVIFTNPLSIALTNCQLTVEAPGIINPENYLQIDVSAEDTFMANLKLVTKRQGRRRIVLVFICKELNDLFGEHEILVQD